MHNPIFLKDICLSFSNKSCFEDFSATIYSGDRIAIIGRNGSGKSSLLKIINKILLPSSGEVNIPNDLIVGYVEQTIDEFSNLSGGQRFNKRLSQILSQSPDILLLDEPTNHLDKDNRSSLKRMLMKYHGTVIIVTHDTELLRSYIDTLWHIDGNRIHQFAGSYDDYIRSNSQKRASIAKEITSLKKDEKESHNELMKEQKRARNNKAYGEKKFTGDKLSLRAAQSRGQNTTSKNSKFINDKKSNLSSKLSELYVPEIILPKFSISPENISDRNILSISNADIGYAEDKPILTDISLSLGGKERIAISGKNGSGKSTLLRAILEDKMIVKTGNWYLPEQKHIGYLDQHYSNLSLELSVTDHIKQIRSDWDEAHVRSYLNDFLFRKNEEVTQFAGRLSGGEKARLSLCIIAAKTPKLLILDEITNNIDLETKNHVIQVLREYSGAMIVVSHDEGFIKAINIDHVCVL